jgi:hypothetical protein
MAKYRSDIILLSFFLFGIISGRIPILIFFLTLGFFLYAIFKGFTSPKEEAYLYAGFLGGMELLIRMADTPLFHEFTKYAISLLLIIGMIKRRENKTPVAIVIFGLLLIPSILMVEGGIDVTRKMISGNLSGPFCLVVASVYFYRRALLVSELRSLFLYILYPLAAMIGYLIVNTPDLSQVNFTTESNFATSVWGPNQVSSILGMGILLIGISYLLKLRLYSVTTSVIFLLFLLFRGLLTFARGGMVAPLLVLSMVFIYFLWNSRKYGLSFTRIGALLVFFVFVGYATFSYTNSLTGDALYKRYSGEKEGREVTLDDYTSGRSLILLIDWQMFNDNLFLGVGPGMGKDKRADYGYPFAIAAHNEFSRLLAEHGIFGFIALLILIFFPVVMFYKYQMLSERILIISLVGFCFAFMSHSATRIALPSFFYGLAFIRVISLAGLKRFRKRINTNQPTQRHSGLIITTV